jgi:nucleoside-diphosphate-sugar epimerase
MSIDKAKTLLGYTPRYTSLEGVYDSLAWLVSNRKIDVGGRQPSR